MPIISLNMSFALFSLSLLFFGFPITIMLGFLELSLGSLVCCYVCLFFHSFAVCISVWAVSPDLS